MKKKFTIAGDNSRHFRVGSLFTNLAKYNMEIIFP